MKKLVLLLVIILTANVLAVDYTTETADTVRWIAASGDWMVANNWQDVAPTPDWVIPGQGSGNGGLAKIASGVCNLTPSSQPTGNVAGLYIGGTSNATLNISGNMTAGASYLGAGTGSTTTINQTAGNVTIADLTCNTGNCTYNISGGSLTLNAPSDLGDTLGGTSSLIASGTGTTVSGTEIRVGNAGTGYMSISEGASVTTSGYLHLGLSTAYTGSGVVEMSGGSLSVGRNASTQFRVGARGLGIFNQTGGAYDTERTYITYDAHAAGSEYNLSGGSYYANRVTVVGYAADAAGTWKVIGSDITSIETAKLDVHQDSSVLAVHLDDVGSTLIQCFGIKANGDLDEGCVFADGSTLEIGTLSTFDGIAGDVYDIIWSAMGITLEGALNFDYSSCSVDFDYRIVDDTVRGGQLLQVFVVPEPATIALLAFGSLLFARRRHD